MNNLDSRPHLACARWSNRILIVALLGIAYLTLFPFQFNFAAWHGFRTFPFLLGTSDHHARHFDFLLNILLFVPLGFGLSAQLRKRRGGLWASLLVSLAAGAVVSYLVEVLQFYIPTRESGWEDVVSNTIGSVAGFFFFELCGDAILGQLSQLGDAFERWLLPSRIATLLLVYFGIWAGASIPLQHQTWLSNWDEQCALFLGNDASGHHAWKGQVFRLQLWNRALPEPFVYRVMSGDALPEAEANLLASYDFKLPSPFFDQTKLFPTLSPISTNTLSSEIVYPIEMNGTLWLSSKVPVAEITREIQKTSQFTIHIVCTPAEIQSADERIFSISQSERNVNLHLRQEGTNLVLFIRNPLSVTRSMLVWYVPGVFQAGQLRDIVASYDGSEASVYVDGKKLSDAYRLGPGVSFFHSFFFVRTANLRGYVVVYETLIFLPLGLLVGMAARKWRMWGNFGKLLVTAGLLLPPLIFELLLISVSGRRILPGNIVLSGLLGIAGALLINADLDRARNSP